MTTSLSLIDCRKSFHCTIEQLSEEDKKSCNKNQYVLNFKKPKKDNSYKKYIDEVKFNIDNIIKNNEQRPYICEVINRTQSNIILQLKFVSENDAKAVEEQFMIKEKLKN